MNSEKIRFFRRFELFSARTFFPPPKIVYFNWIFVQRPNFQSKPISISGFEAIKTPIRSSAGSVTLGDTSWARLIIQLGPSIRGRRLRHTGNLSSRVVWWSLLVGTRQKIFTTHSWDTERSKQRGDKRIFKAGFIYIYGFNPIPYGGADLPPNH